MRIFVFLLIPFVFSAPGKRRRSELGLGATVSTKPSSIVLKKFADSSLVKIYFDGYLFSNFLYDSVYKKPILFPVFSSRGNMLTRGFPLIPIKGEQGDHLHHTGIWFGYGNINGNDFWTPTNRGYTEHKLPWGKIVTTDVTAQQSKINYRSSWQSAKGEQLMEENTNLNFFSNSQYCGFDRTSKLTAITELAFPDTKDGLFAMRVATAFDQPFSKKYAAVKGSGSDTVSSTPANGLFTSSSGRTGDSVYGSRARWVKLSAMVKGESLSLIFFDHPANINHPCYWMARGYGLFGPNPFGEKDYTARLRSLNYKLAKGNHVTLKYRFLVWKGNPKIEQIETLYQTYVNLPG